MEGVLLGLAAGWLIVQLVKRIEDVIISITVSLLAPFIIYIAAEKIQISSILAVVVAGIVMGWYDPKAISPKKRLKGSAVWETLIFLLNAMAFVLMGLEFPLIIEGLSGENWSYKQLLTLSVAVLVTITVVRFVWMFFAAYVIRAALPKVRKYDPYPPWQQVVIIAWSGMRGIVSLGAALALPLTTLSGEVFPARNLILFITFTTIIGTLVLQGITMPLLIKWLGLKEDEGFINEQYVARGIISKSMMTEIDLLRGNNLISEKTYNITRRECLVYAESEVDENIEKRVRRSDVEIREVRRKIITIGRKELSELHEKGVISKKVTQVIQQELDLDELRLL